jgi:hypothetical protein
MDRIRTADYWTEDLHGSVRRKTFSTVSRAAICLRKLEEMMMGEGLWEGIFSNDEMNKGLDRRKMPAGRYIVDRYTLQ